MSSEVTVGAIRFVTSFPWLKLGRAWGCALSLQQLALACAAAFALTVADAVLRPETTPQFIGVAADWGDSRFAGVEALAGPIRDIVQPAQAFLSGSPGWWRHGIAAVLAFVLWSVVGPMLARLTAIQFGRDENPSLQDAVQFGVNRAGVVCGAPAIPLGFALTLCLVIAVLALPGWIPALGQLWLIVLSPVLFVLGATAAFVALTVPILWPLMVAAVSVDDGDAFDAFSRAFSLVASRFWSTFFLIAICALHALVAVVLLTTLADATATVAGWSADWMAGQHSVHTVSSWVAWWAAIAVRGVMASLFWTLATIVYLVLREAVDGKPVHQLSGVEPPMPSRGPYPVVGVSAVQPPAEPGPPASTNAAQEV
jgi:hypothetical protein